MVVPDSNRVSRVPFYSTIIIIRLRKLNIPGYHRLWLVFPDYSARFAICNLMQVNGSTCLHYGCSDKIRTSVVVDYYVTTPLKYSSTNLSSMRQTYGTVPLKMFYIYWGPQFFLSHRTIKLIHRLGLCFSLFWEPYAYHTLETLKVWAIPVSLATTPRIIGYFLFLEVLRCFSSPGSLQ